MSVECFVTKQGPFSPYKLVYRASVALYDFDHLVGHIFVHVVGNWDAMASLSLHAHGDVHGLEETLGVDARKDEARFVQGLGALGGGTDAHRREGLAHAGEEAGLLGQRAGIAYHTEGVGLQTVVIVEAQGLVADHALVQLKAALLDALAAARMAAVQYGHSVLLRHCVHGREQADEVLLGVDVLLAVGAEQDVSLLPEPQPLMDV